MKIISLFFTLISLGAYSQLTLDTTFANDGFLNYNGMRSAEQIATDSNERIVCWSKSISNQNAIVRFLPDGAIDTSFGTNGSINIEYQGAPLVIARILVQDNGEIFFFGKTNETSFAKLILGKLNVNGAVDTNFGTNGFFTLNSSFEDVRPISLIEYNGKFLLASLMIDTNIDTFNTILIKINLDGTLDQTFGDNGSKVNEIRYGVFCSALKTDNSGNIYLSGDDDMQYYYISKYTSNGSMDSSFGDGGETRANIQDHAISHSLELTDNKIYVFGEFDGFEPQPPISYRKTAVAVFNLANGNYIEVKKFVGGAEIFDGGFASYQFSDGKILFGGSVSYQASGGPQLTKVLKWNEDLTDIEASLDFDFYPTNILSYSKQGSKVLVAGNRTNMLFITRIYDGTLAVDEVDSSTSFNVYPNPTSSEFKIKTVEAIKSVKINDDLGKNIATYGEQDTYDISRFSAGIYFIYIETESKVGIKKLIIE